MIPGDISCSVCSSNLHFLKIPALKFSNTTSDFFNSLWIVSIPFSDLTLIVKLFFPAFKLLKKAPLSSPGSSSLAYIENLIKSGFLGHSTFITSAPKAAKTLAVVEPDTLQVKSKILIPSKDSFRFVMIHCPLPWVSSSLKLFHHLPFQILLPFLNYKRL